MEIKEAVEALNNLSKSSDWEVAHSKADEILLSFVPPEVAEAWDKVPKWYA